MTLSAIDVLVFVAFYGLVLGVSLWKSRGRRTSEDYFLGGRRLPWWLIGVSIVAANISTEQFVGMAGQAAGERRPRGERVAARRRGGDRDRGLHLPAALPAGRHLHDAGVPRVPLQPGRADGDVRPHRRHLRDRHHDRRPLLRGDRARDDLRPEPSPRARRDLRHRDRVRALGRAPRRGVGRPLPGLGPPRGRAPDPRPRARRGGRAGRLPPGERRPPAHDPAAQPPRAAVDGAPRRDVDPEPLLLRPQPVHHPAHARRPLARARARRGSSSPRRSGSSSRSRSSCRAPWPTSCTGPRSRGRTRPTRC